MPTAVSEVLLWLKTGESQAAGQDECPGRQQRREWGQRQPVASVWCGASDTESPGGLGESCPQVTRAHRGAAQGTLRPWTLDRPGWAVSKVASRCTQGPVPKSPRGRGLLRDTHGHWRERACQRRGGRTAAETPQGCCRQTAERPGAQGQGQLGVENQDSNIKITDFPEESNQTKMTKKRKKPSEKSWSTKSRP